MKIVRFSFLFLFTYLISTVGIFAHVKLNYPIGGEIFAPGDIINIQWQITISHDQDNWDLYFSHDGVENWEVIRLNLETSQFNYQWTVPQIVTENAKIRIVMDNTDSDYDDISGDFTIQGTSTSVEQREDNPKTFTLHANYPNPFNPTTTISYELSNTGNIELTIFNQLGQEVRTLVNEQQNANYYEIRWDGRDDSAKQVVSGLYIYRLKVNSFSRTRKMVLLR